MFFCSYERYVNAADAKRKNDSHGAFESVRFLVFISSFGWGFFLRFSYLQLPEQIINSTQLSTNEIKNERQEMEEKISCRACETEK